jgi:hypothetical protein
MLQDKIGNYLLSNSIVQNKTGSTNFIPKTIEDMAKDIAEICEKENQIMVSAFKTQYEIMLELREDIAKLKAKLLKRNANILDLEEQIKALQSGLELTKRVVASYETKIANFLKSFNSIDFDIIKKKNEGIIMFREECYDCDYFNDNTALKEQIKEYELINKHHTDLIGRLEEQIKNIDCYDKNGEIIGDKND